MALLEQLQKVIEENFHDEQLGVEELASKLNMSRSQLHRKLKQATGQSANQFIREYRLERAMELLKKGDVNVSEVAFQVGFGSASYFTTCFTDHYGYPPGEVKHRMATSTITPTTEIKAKGGISKSVIIITLVLITGIVGAFIYYNKSLDVNVRGVSLDNSIAILPFKNLNADEENMYFSEGVTEAINRHLSQMKDIRLISLTSTGRYRESDKSAFEIGDELSVSHLLEGSIQRSENKVRIEVRLVDAYSEQQVWAKNYDRELKDIFDTQTDIAEQVTLALKSTLTPQEKQLLSYKATSNVEAYDLYLKGVFAYRTYTRTGIHQAIDFFKQAVDLDPNYALAYNGLGATYILQSTVFGAEINHIEAMEQALPLFEKALELEPDMLEPHFWIGMCYLFKDWNFEAAEREYKMGMVNNDRDALYIYSDFLNFTRRHEEALAVHEKMAELDPYFPNNLMVLSLFYLGRYEEAYEVGKYRVSMFNNYTSLDSYGFLLLNTGKYEEAIKMFKRVIDIEGVRYPRMLGWTGAAYAHLGQPEMSQQIIDELKEQRKTSNAGSNAFFLAIVYAALGDKTTAIEWLQESYKLREMELPWLISEPQLYPLHDEPAFQELVKKIGFPEY